MNYWIIKGRKKLNAWHEWMFPGQTEIWHTGKLPKDFTKGDRVIFWESSPSNKVIGLATVSNPNEGVRSDGEQLYRLRALTRPFEATVTKAELVKVPALDGAFFLKQGPAHSIVSLTPPQAKSLFNLLRARNPNLETVWPDLVAANAKTSHQVPPLEIFEADEGNPRLVTHLRRERDVGLVRRKKAQCMRANGNLKCEVCGFDFEVFYGEKGFGFCEVHHLTAMAESNEPRTTALTDLAVVCSNCHRMLHRSYPAMSLENLAALVASTHGGKSSALPHA